MYKKITIIGAPGTGKTTLSNNLSKLLNIKVLHIDGLHYLKNWQIRNKEERDKLILEVTIKDSWIIDGTYKATLKQRLEAADLIIWLDFSTINQLKGVIERFIKSRGKEKPEIPGCNEKLDKEFLLYVLRYNKNKRQIIINNLDKIDKNKIVVLKNRKQVNNWLKNLERSV